MADCCLGNYRGTICGVITKIKEECPKCRVVGVDHAKSTLSDPESEPGVYELEGIGSDFQSAVLNKSLIDEWVKADDKAAFEMARRLIREEGILCGGSSGANVWAACKAAAGLPKGKKVVAGIQPLSNASLRKIILINPVAAK
ncbi:hypothetical protein QR680_014122 [Steinernema hermaphroditum]|uniref:Tryptophan synthase beta chain-like PALP domain-containing protein n=1 Tax=Steinernema hermaphroditum TaxID=289476 RepID=A0AA39IAI1_9BILA|nr:hypothetical protein QR680_014122 [Steinernema hermaphroditum]